MGKATILIVDDKIENLNMFSNLLQNQTYKIHTADDSRLAIDICNQMDFDLIIMDVRMPADGFKTYHKIVKTTRNSDTPVIYMVEKTDLENINKAFRLGCQDLITKPFQIDEVRSRISIHTSLILQQKQLKELIAAKDKFNMILAHDLKSPFSGIVGLSEILAENVRNYDIDKIETIINSINKSAKSTYKLLEDLFLWAKAQSGKLPFEPKKLDLNNTCKSTLASLAPSADTKEVKIKYIAPDGLKVYADIDMLKTVLRNLISNAIKFSNKGGEIIISAVNEETDTKIIIEDNGIGIGQSSLSKLFKLSEVISTRGTSDEKGSGLGLLLCQQFIDIHGGKIWVESEAGRGSRFNFTLPDKVNS